MTSPATLITGASGFIGIHLCRALHDAGFTVRAAIRNPLPAGHSAHETAHVGEIGPGTDWDVALKGVDCVVHLAALAHQIGKPVSADRFHKINAEATATLASAIAKSPTVRRLIFISSIGAVCSMSKTQITDTTSCTPDTDYGRSKLAAELAVQSKLRDTSADWTILRPTLVYGPDNPGNMLRLLQLVRSGAPLPFASIKNRRSFIFVGNLVDAILKCMPHPAASRQVFNVSDNETLSTPDLIRTIARVNSRKVSLVPFPASGLRLLGRFGDLASSFGGRSLGIDSYSVERLLGSLEVNNSGIRNALGWNPPFTVEEGLSRTLRPVH